jgi:hypothetical protein
MIVAPVTAKGATEKRFRLGRGIWFDLHGDTRVEGGREFAVPVTLQDIPVFIRAGAFVPMIGDIATTRDYRSDRLTVHYYHDRSVRAGAGEMYEDDGKTRNAAARGQFELLRFASAASGGGLEFKLRRERRGRYTGQPASRQITLVVHNWDGPARGVAVDGRSASSTYDAATRRLTVTFPWSARDAAVALR